jgi:peptidoglycan/LPS O-acetylase OafA/YrhL
MNEQQPAYLNALTFPRFILAILVVIFHYGLHLDLFKESFFVEFFKNGAVAVSFFFFLSGFVLAYNYNETKTKSFLLKRVFRIFPIYIITFFVVLISQLLLNLDTPTLFYSIMNSLGLQSWFPGHALQVNFPSWSISVEFFLYASFPIILWLYKKMKWKYFVFLSIVIIVLGWLQHYYFVVHLYDPNRYFLEQFILYFPLFHLSTFIAGFLGGKWIFNLKKVKLNPFIFPIMATIGIACFILILNFENPIRLLSHNGGLIPVFFIICIGLALDKSFYYHFFGSSPLIYLGNISYGVYMWQFPIFILFSTICDTGSLTIYQFIWYVIILIAWSSISYELIEKPSRKFLSNRFLNKN